MLTKKSIVRSICIGAFFGLMVPGLGGLIFPSMLINVGGPVIISGSDKIVLQTHDYSYKPGECGREYHFYCVSNDGKEEEITMTLVFSSIAIYSIIFIVLLIIISFIYQRFKINERATSYNKL